MATSPPTITALPTPPDPADRATFNTLAYPWSVAQGVLAEEVGEVATNVYNNALDGATQAALATTNGQAQVTLAAAQVTLAHDEVGLAAAQVTLAAGQVTLATAQAVIATDKAVLTAADAVATAADRVQTGLDRSATSASQLAMDKRYLGSKASAPTLDNQGAALATGAVYYDTALSKVRTWNGSAWVEGISSVAGVASVNGLTGAVLLPPTQSLTYANRANLRSQTPAAGEQAIVDTLGLFVWESGSTEPDDDKTCFATASGRWLMQAAHWDIVDELVIPEITAAAAKTLTGSATCAIASLTSANSASFTGTVTGAAIGDRVVATPPAELGSNINETARLTYHAWVSAPDTVTIMLCNPVNGATTNPAIRTAWPITVIKA